MDVHKDIYCGYLLKDLNNIKNLTPAEITWCTVKDISLFHNALVLWNEKN